MPPTENIKKIALFLLTDSDPVLTRVIKNKFEKAAGWQSIIATSYDMALAEFEKASPDAVIVEILIRDNSGKTGFDLIAEISKKTKNSKPIPLMVFSELSQEEDKQKAKTLGATHYFVKSEITIQELITQIHLILES